MTLDKFQRIRLKRLTMAMGTYVLVIVYAYLIKWSGVGDFTQTQAYTMIISAIAGNVFFVMMILSGLNRQLPDPSMTQLQILFSAAWGMIALLALPDSRTLVLLLYIPSFLFGALILKRAAYLRLAAMISLLLASLQVYEYHYVRPEMNIAYEMLIWACFTILLIWCALFGSFLARARFLVRRQNIALQQNRDKLAKMTEELQLAAYTDSLTGALNRRAFYEQIEALLISEQRGNQSHGLLLLDVDHFKKLNDTQGHAVGDEVLVIIAQRIKNQLRTTDLLVRWGGEEFLVLLQQANKYQTLEAAERIRLACAKVISLKNDDEIVSTVSVGCTYNDDFARIDNAIKAADIALYEAKNSGRNQVKLAP